MAPSKALQQLQPDIVSFYAQPPLQHPTLVWSFAAARTLFLYGIETDLSHLQRLRSSSSDDIVFFYAQPPLQHRRLVWSLAAPAPRRPCWQSGAVFLYGFETDLWHLQRLCSSSSLFLCSATLAEPKPGVELCLPSTKPCWQPDTVFLYGFETDLWHLQRPCSRSSDDLVFFYAQPPCSTEGVLRPSTKACSAASHAQSSCTVSRLTFGTFKGFAAARTVFLYGFETDLWHLQRLCSSSSVDIVFFYALPPLRHPRLVWSFVSPAPRRPCWQPDTCSFEPDLWHLQRPCSSSKKRPCLFLRAATLAAPKACSVSAPRRALLAVRRSLFVPFRD